MTKEAVILNGSEIAEKRLRSASERVQAIQKAGAELALATVQVGDSKDTALYAATLTRLFKKVGIRTVSSVSPQNIAETELCGKIAKLNHDPAVTGILVFAPLPPHIDCMAVLNALDQLKDVEGRTFMKSHFGVFSPTANAVLTLIEHARTDLAGKEAVVVGASDLVGKPTAILLMDKMATVTVCHVLTKDIRRKIETADIVVAAAGRPRLVKGDWIKKGAVVIDVGENVTNSEVAGDVEFETAKKRAAYLSPVPGGVGPLTNVMLIENLIRLHELGNKLNGNN